MIKLVKSQTYSNMLKQFFLLGKQIHLPEKLYLAFVSLDYLLCSDTIEINESDFLYSGTIATNTRDFVFERYDDKRLYKLVICDNFHNIFYENVEGFSIKADENRNIVIKKDNLQLTQENLSS